ncbi:hypothetical protein [Methylomonas sp. AM2-LC]|uniref:hypothetical protein n=1 Tax=Methylomonas sp. AM2-LC TaxID=3153301 RepID=UPI00326380E1
MSKLGASPVGIYSDDGNILLGSMDRAGNFLSLVKVFTTYTAAQAYFLANPNVPSTSVLIGQTTWIWDGVGLTLDTPIENVFTVLSIGNSINAKNQVGYAANSFFGASPSYQVSQYQNGILEAINTLGGQPFKPCRSVPTIFHPIAAYTGSGGSTGYPACIDELGTYAAPAYSLSAPNASYVGAYMLQDFDGIFKTLIDTPNLVILLGIFENDMGQNPYTASQLATMQLSLQQAISKILNQYPNILIVVFTPGPNSSYPATSNYAAITNWMVNTLPGLYPGNVFTYLNQAITDNIVTGAPITKYVDQGVHPNRDGATLIAKDFIKKMSFLFNVPKFLPSIDTASGGVFVNDPYILSASTGTLNAAAGAKTAVPGTSHLLYTLDGYTGGQTQASVTNVGTNGSGTPVGLDIMLAGKTVAIPYPTSSNGTVAGITLSTDNFGNFNYVQPNNVYVALWQVKIINPTNLIELKATLTMDDSYHTYGFAGQTTDFQDNYQGWATLNAGDILNIATPPILIPGVPTGSAHHLTTQMFFGAAAATPLDFSTPANNPHIQVNLVTIYQVANNIPTQPYTIVGSNTYINQSEGLQQVLFQPGTASYSGTLTANITAATTGTLNALFTGPTGQYSLTFTTAGGPVVLTATLTNNSAAITAISSAVTTTALGVAINQTGSITSAIYEPINKAGFPTMTYDPYPASYPVAGNYIVLRPGDQLVIVAATLAPALTVVQLV